MEDEDPGTDFFKSSTPSLILFSRTKLRAIFEEPRGIQQGPHVEQIVSQLLRCQLTMIGTSNNTHYF